MNLITSHTKLTGIIGHPVSHSLSPVMHNAAFEDLGLDYRYLAFEVLPNNLEKTVEGFRAIGVAGFNVTVPYKLDVMQYLDQVSPEAQIIGAVNTVVNNAGILVGYNTDAKGFLLALKKEADINKKNILIIGAGGAARAVVFSFASESVREIVVCNRTKEKADDLVADVKQAGINLPIFSKVLDKKNISQADIIINTTSLGLKTGEESIVPKDWLMPEKICMDLIYNPEVTPFLACAKQQGCKTINGLGMLIEQGRLAFKLWTGKEPSYEVMKKAIK